MSEPSQPLSLKAEVREILHRGVQVWHLVPRTQKKALGGAALVMALGSATGTAVALLLGRLVDAVTASTDGAVDVHVLYQRAGIVLGLIAVAYVFREVLNVARRYLVENTCSRINRDMSVRLVSHLMRVHMNLLNHDKLGALHGRIFRSVDGFVRFLRVAFLDFLPALLTGLFALIAAVTKQPILGLIMLGVVPLTVWLTVRQLMSQKAYGCG